MKRFFLMAACFVCILAIAGPASAVTIGTSQLVGTKDWAQPADIANENDYANNLIVLYNAGATGGGYTTNPSGPPVFGPTLPDLPLIAAGDGVRFATFAAAGDTTAYSYVWTKLGNSGALYYLGGLTESVSGIDPNPFGPTGSGLSHVTFFGPTQVPEAGTLMLLGFGLAGVGTFRRFMKR